MFSQMVQYQSLLDNKCWLWLGSVLQLCSLIIMQASKFSSMHWYNVRVLKIFKVEHYCKNEKLTSQEWSWIQVLGLIKIKVDSKLIWIHLWTVTSWIYLISSLRFPNVLIVTTSNISGTIDLAFVDRADIKQYIGLPSRAAIYQIYYSCINEMKRVRFITNYFFVVRGLLM